MAKDERKQINIRVSDEFLQAVGDIQRLDRSEPTALNQTDAITKAVLGFAEQLRKAKRK